MAETSKSFEASMERSAGGIPEAVSGGDCACAVLREAA